MKKLSDNNETFVCLSFNACSKTWYNSGINKILIEASWGAEWYFPGEDKLIRVKDMSLDLELCPVCDTK